MLWVPQEAEVLLTSWATVIFYSRQSMLNGAVRKRYEPGSSRTKLAQFPLVSPEVQHSSQVAQLWGLSFILRV
jgi:hypothetical protein